MSDGKKKRLSMLDNIAQAKAPAPSMMATNRALRSARDAVDGHNVWDLDPSTIEDTRIADRLEPSDVDDLRQSIETNGQTVPILVRRHPEKKDHYLLVYGRRRLEAVRQSGTVEKVRALIANLDEDEAVRAQVSENIARRDLSYIEKALFADQLVNSEFGTQKDVAEVLSTTKSWISMALGIVRSIDRALFDAIGPAPGIGRPRWEALARLVSANHTKISELLPIAEAARQTQPPAQPNDGEPQTGLSPSVAAFEAVHRVLARFEAVDAPKAVKTPAKALRLDGKKAGKMKRSETGLHLEISNSPFADWLEQEAETVLTELHARWKMRSED